MNKGRQKTFSPKNFIFFYHYLSVLLIHHCLLWTVGNITAGYNNLRIQTGMQGPIMCVRCGLPSQGYLIICSDSSVLRQSTYSWGKNRRHRRETWTGYLQAKHSQMWGLNWWGVENPGDKKLACFTTPPQGVGFGPTNKVIDKTSFYTIKIIKNSDTWKFCWNHPKIWTKRLYHRVMYPKDADGMANSVDSDQTAPSGALWSGCTLFAQTDLSENLGSLW